MPEQEKVNIWEFERGGLRVSDVDVEFIEARWGGWSYPGKADLGEQLAAICSLKVIGSEGAELEEQAWTGGSLSDWEPSEDGKTMRSLGPDHIRDTTNWSLFVASLKDKGLQTEKLDPNDITSIVGLQCHVIMEQVERPGLDNPTGQVLVCSQLIKAPWEKKSAKTRKEKAAEAAAAKKATQSATAKVDGAPTLGGEVDLDLAGVLLMEALTEDVPVEVPDLIKRVFLAAKNAGRTAEFMPISKLIRDDAQLGPIVAGLGFRLEGTTVS